MKDIRQAISRILEVENPFARKLLSDSVYEYARKRPVRAVPAGAALFEEKP